MQSTELFEKIYQTKARIVVLQGGTGSGKSWALAQLFNLKIREQTGQVFTVVRKALPTLKATAMKDYFTIMKSEDWYDVNNHNRTDLIYKHLGNEIEFFGLDDLIA